jgi:hypothetical protein
MAGLSLVSNGADWMGTFARTARFIVVDLLSDGAPVDVTAVTYENRTISGALTQCSPEPGSGFLIVDGQKIGVESIIELHID